MVLTKRARIAIVSATIVTAVSVGSYMIYKQHQKKQESSIEEVVQDAKKVNEVIEAPEEIVEQFPRSTPGEIIVEESGEEFATSTLESDDEDAEPVSAIDDDRFIATPIQIAIPEVAMPGAQTPSKLTSVNKPLCCNAMTASCNACKKNMSVEQYCKSSPMVTGCPDQKRMYSYVDLGADCRGNQINDYGNVGLEKCKANCTNNSNCMGFTTNKDGRCILKSKTCKPTQMVKGWTFFHKHGPGMTSPQIFQIADTVQVIPHIDIDNLNRAISHFN